MTADRSREAPVATFSRAARGGRWLRERVSTALVERLSPERTRRATLLERMTARRLSWDQLVRFNCCLAFVGKLATAVWVAFIASIVLGVDWKVTVEETLNSGSPVEGAIFLAFLLPTLVFLAVRSLLGLWRWRLQRELWRRDVERYTRESS